MRALRGGGGARAPIWLMRQAGRYLPEYRRLRARAGSFLNLVETPELACEATLQPIARFGFDAAILFSDILTAPNAMGLGLRFVDGEGPRFLRPLQDEASIAALRPPPPEALEFVRGAARLCARELKIPLIGFCGSPFTLACYMIDGRGDGSFLLTRKMRIARPDLLEAVLAANVRATADSLAAQAESGAAALMIFDSWGGLLQGADYRRFSLAPIARVIDDLRARGARQPLIVFARGGGGARIARAAETGCACVGVDWQTSLKAARRALAGKAATQGNLDPAALLADEKTVIRETRRVLRAAGDGRGFVLNLGHGIDRRTPPQNVEAMVRTARETGFGAR